MYKSAPPINVFLFCPCVDGIVFLIFGVQLLLRKKAAEELKKEQERKAQERRKVIDERCGNPKDLESASEGKCSKLPVFFSLKNQFVHTSKIESIEIYFYFGNSYVSIFA